MHHENGALACRWQFCLLKRRLLFWACMSGYCLPKTGCPHFGVLTACFMPYPSFCMFLFTLVVFPEWQGLEKNPAWSSGWVSTMPGMDLYFASFHVPFSTVELVVADVFCVFVVKVSMMPKCVLQKQNILIELGHILSAKIPCGLCFWCFADLSLTKAFV